MTETHENSFQILQYLEENEVKAKLSEETINYVRIRMEQELQSIEREEERLTKAMNDQILDMKKRLMHDLYSRMQKFATSDEPNMKKYKEVCPDLFSKFNPKNSKKRSKRKTKTHKLPMSLAEIDQPMDEEVILFDLAGVREREEDKKELKDLGNSVIMITENGQKWFVNVEKMDEDLQKITYCDGSSSLVTDFDMRALNLSFEKQK